MRSPQSSPWRPAPPGQRRQTLGHYLDDWLAGKARLRASTRRTYAEHIRLYLTPALGHLRLDQLDAVDIERMYTAIRGLGTSTGRAPSPEVKAMLAVRQRSQPARSLTAARLRRIHTTLMSALNTAVKRRLLPSTPRATSSSTPAGDPRPSSGPSSARRTGAPPVNGRRSRSGSRRRPGRSSTTPRGTGSTRCCT